VLPLLLVAIVTSFSASLPGGTYSTSFLGHIIAVLTFAAVMGSWGWLSVRNSRVTSSPGRLRVTNFTGTAHDVAAHHLARVLMVTSVERISTGGNRDLGPRLFVLDETGHSVLRLTPNMWTVDQMDLLAKSLALPIELIEEPITFRELGKRYPVALRMSDKHPVLAVVAVIVFVAAVVVVLAFATSGR
jgi:hypothetical protein